MLKRLLDRNIQYNILSLFNVFIGFLFILYLGRKFGAGTETDIYFVSMVIIGYLGYIVQSVWEAMSPYYIEKKVKDKIASDELYSILLNDLILVSLAVISIYFIMTSFFDFISGEQKSFLDVFVFYLLFQNILLFNKTILNLEHFYASYYFVDIFVYGVLFVTVIFFVKTEILYIAYATLVATFIANVWQAYLIHKKLEVKYSFVFYNSNLKEIYKNSFKLKIGSLLYGSKDIIIASVFTSLGSGMFSLYSYANKFAGVILQVVNAPVVNIFATKANYHVANNRYDLLKSDIKKVLSQTIILFSISGGITYVILPYLLSVLFDDKFSDGDIMMMQNIFLVLLFFYLVVVIENPFARLGSIFKLFTFGLVVNFIFAISILISFGLFKLYELNYIQFLCLVIVSQLFNLSLAYLRYKYYLRNRIK